MVEETPKIKELYPYQKEDIDKIFKKINSKPQGYNLCYQLPTGGGKTVVFSEIVRRYIEEQNKKVLILTHRIELCNQTSKMLDGFGVTNKIINSKVKEIPNEDDYMCFVAMVETLNNRLNEEKVEFNNLGMVKNDLASFSALGSSIFM